IREVVLFQSEVRAGGAARNVVEHIMEEQYPDSVPVTEGVLRLQVIDQDTQEVLASSEVLRDYPALTDIQPDTHDFRLEDTICDDVAGPYPNECLLVVGYTVENSAYGDVLVIAAVRSPQFLETGILETGMVAISLTVLVVSTFSIWY